MVVGVLEMMVVVGTAPVPILQPALTTASSVNDAVSNEAAFLILPFKLCVLLSSALRYNFLGGRNLPHSAYCNILPEERSNKTAIVTIPTLDRKARKLAFR